jgi:hypothetical protein
MGGGGVLQSILGLATPLGIEVWLLAAFLRIVEAIHETTDYPFDACVIEILICVSLTCME